MSETSQVISVRREIVAFVEVRDGNPNGDPDMGNAPRIDSGTGQGLMTDVSIKRVVRDYVSDAFGEAPGCRIFVSNGAVLETLQREGFEATGHLEAMLASPEPEDVAEDARRPGKGAKQTSGKAPKRVKGDAEVDARRWLCENYYDIRAFGAVLAGKGFSAGSVNGPVQVAFARSVDPISFDEVAITRCAVNSEAEKAKERTIGRKHIVPYALYRIEARISPSRADGPKGTGFTDEDMSRFEKALLEGFEHRGTASKGHMATRRMMVFEHRSKLGEAPAFELFERVSALRKVAVPRSFADYDITVNDAEMPNGVTLRIVR